MCFAVEFLAGIAELGKVDFRLRFGNLQKYDTMHDELLDMVKDIYMSPSDRHSAIKSGERWWHITVQQAPAPSLINGSYTTIHRHTLATVDPSAIYCNQFSFSLHSPGQRANTSVCLSIWTDPPLWETATVRCQDSGTVERGTHSSLRCSQVIDGMRVQPHGDWQSVWRGRRAKQSKPAQHRPCRSDTLSCRQITGQYNQGLPHWQDTELRVQASIRVTRSGFALRSCLLNVCRSRL